MVEWFKGREGKYCCSTFREDKGYGHIEPIKMEYINEEDRG